MKKHLLFLLILFSSIAYGQVPNQINYQGIARNSVGNVLPNKSISVRLSIHDGNNTGLIVYQELRHITTSNFGLFNIAIGSSGAIAATGTIATVNWGSGAKFLQVEIDPTGGSSFIDLGAAQLLSVPYALFSGNAITSSPSGAANGDLSGSYPNPSIADGAVTTNKLGDNAVTTSKIDDGSVTSAKLAAGVIPTSLPPNGASGGDLSGTYPNPTIGVDAITTSKILDGSVTTAKLAAGVIPTSLPPNGTAGGDLSGTYPNPVIGNNAVTTSKILNGSVTLAKLAAGVIPTSLPPNGTAGGDLSGTYPNPSVNKLLGVSINGTAPVTGQVLKFNGTQWTAGTDNSIPSGAAGGDLSGSYPNPTIANSAITTIKILNGSVTAAKLAAGVIPTSLPPSGTAGGDLAGTYPNPTIRNNAITTGKILNGSVTSSKLAAGVIPTSLPPNGAAGGDLSGTYPNPTVSANAITTTKLADNTVTTSKIVNASVTAAKLAAGVIPTSLPPNGAAGGDLSGTYPNPTIGINAITTTKLLDGSVTAAKLAAGVIPTSLSPSGTAGGDLSGTYPNPTVGINAITSTKILDGSVTLTKLAAGVIPTSLPPNGTAGGDLAGTYPNPTVNQIQGVSVNNGAPTIGQVLKFDGTQWSPGTDNSGSGSPTGSAGGDLSGSYPNPNIASGAVTTPKIANGSIVTPKIVDGAITAAKLAAGVIPTSLPPNGAAGGDLSGTYPDPTIGINAITTAKILDGSVTAAKLAAGILPTSLPPNGAAGGDLSGTYPNPSISKLVGVSLNGTAPTTGQVLKFDGVQWSPGTDNSGSGSPTGPAGGALTGTYPNPTIADNAVTPSKILDASITAAKLAAGVIPISLPPNGAAGGDLSGTYPNPTIGINAITTTKILDGSVTAAKLSAGIIPTSLPPNGAAGGDLSGTYPNPTIGINAVTTTKILDGSVTAAKLSGGIIPTSLPPNGVAGGDLSGSYPNPNVNKIQGTAVISAAPVSGQVLKFNGTQWAPGTDNTGAFALPYSNSLSSAQNLISVTNGGTGAGLEGINSSTNANAFGVIGKISSASPGTSSAAILGINSGTGSNGIGVWGSHSGFGTGVYGTSVNNNGVWGYSANGNGVFGTSDNYNAGYFDISNASNSSDAIAAFTVGTGPAVYGSSDQGFGIWGITYNGFASGIYGLNAGGGEAVTGITTGAGVPAVVGKNAGDNGIGVSAIANAGGTVNGTALLASLESAGGYLAVFQVGGTNMARIDDTGKGFFNGGTQNSGADVAEAFDIEGVKKDYEPGDVLVISQNGDRKVEKSSEPYSTLVAGVYATKPGLLLTEQNAEQNQLDKMVPMGVVGVIPTKVCLEGGAIKRGDLLVTSSTSGVAMKADLDRVKVGQVIGKALQEYNQVGVGKINVLVSIK